MRLRRMQHLKCFSDVALAKRRHGLPLPFTHPSPTLPFASISASEQDRQRWILSASVDPPPVSSARVTTRLKSRRSGRFCTV